jgi:hypothetical protein
MRRGHDGFSFGDHTQPLWRWIRKQVGRPFDVVYSEFCRSTDKRNIRGWHLHQHFDAWVDRQDRRETNRWGTTSWKFFVDQDGILRRYPPAVRVEHRPDPDALKINGRSFVRIDGTWFELTTERRPIGTYFDAETMRRHAVLGDILVKRTLSAKERDALLPSQNPHSRL